MQRNRSQRRCFLEIPQQADQAGQGLGEEGQEAHIHQHSRRQTRHWVDQEDAIHIQTSIISRLSPLTRDPGELKLCRTSSSPHSL